MMTTRIKVGLTAGTCLIFSQSLMAEVSVFNPALLEIDHQSGVDIRQFNRANLMPPGVYSVDIFINGKMFERQDVNFVQDNPDADLHACFVAIKKTLTTFGVKVDALKSLNDVDETVCIDPGPRIEGSSWQFDSDKLQLNISIPQIYMDAMAYDYISPSRWDEGINALTINYDFSGSHTLRSDYGSQETDTSYLNLRNGLNIGPWRLRNYSTLNTTDGSAEYNSISTWIQRDIAALRSQIMIGDTWTASDIFDSTQIRGARLYTDNDMLPASQNGFAPVVRGIAKSNATVIIRQNGYVIYQSAVPQGAFEITDLNTASTGGDLDVTIKEEDGSEQRFTQPYASLAILKREGQTDVDVSVGELRDEDGFTPDVIQAQILHGFPYGFTLYGGMQAAEKYGSAALGVGKDLGALGAISFDVTHARAKFSHDDTETGQSYRFLYSKRFDDTDTSLRLVGYRYSTEGYYTLNEWASRRNNPEDFWETGNRRSRVEGTLTQSLGRDYGNLYLTLSRQQYWHTDDVERLMQFGYSSSWKRLSWNVSWSYSNTARQGTGNNHASDNTSEQIYMLSLSVPLSGWWGNSYATYSVSQNDNSGSSHQLGLSGTALERNNLSWNLMQSYNSHDDEVGGNMSLTYDGTYGTVNGSYNYSQNSQRLNYGIRGGILAHSEGVTLSQELGETIALVKAPGAAGLEIDNMRGAATDWRGYTVKTQLNPYDENRVAISDNYFSKSNIELDNTVVTMVPTRGAVVKAEFVTRVGYRVLFRVAGTQGKPAPFGAIATVQNTSSADSGIVGDQGELYLSGLPEKGQVMLSWGENVATTCTFDYSLSIPESESGLIEQGVTCH
ncbi:fimbrial biogenesis outer membrane usher protein [Escherichia coli]|nr:fimbrial biogenesis outer membrane usher protein [Escherichia coli]